MNLGVYRAGGAVGGLPLPRTHLTVATVAIVGFALAAIVLPLVSFAVLARSASGAAVRLKEGGLAMYVLLLLDVGIPVVLAFLGALLARGKRIPAAFLFAGAASPAFVACLGAFLGMRAVVRALAFGAIDPEQVKRILAEGTKESMACDELGSLVAAGSAVVAARAAARAGAPNDRARAAGPTKSSARGAILAGACGTLWLVAAIVIGVLRVRAVGPAALLPVLVVLALVPAAVLSGGRSAVLRDFHDRAEASAAIGALVVAGLSALLAVFALERALEASATSRALSAFGSISLAESERMLLVAEGLEAAKLAPASYAVHAVLGTATFAAALVPAVGRGPDGALRHPMTPSMIASLGVGVLLSGLALGLGHQRTSAARDISTAPVNEGVQLPATESAFLRDELSVSTRFVVRKDGSGERVPSGYKVASFTAYADRGATIAMVRDRLPREKRPQLSFAVQRKHSRERVDALGELSVFLTDTGYVTGFVDDGTMPTIRWSRFVTVRSIDAHTVEIDGKRVSLSSATTFDGPRLDGLRYRFREEDSVEHAMHVVDVVERMYGSRITPSSFDRVFELGEDVKR